MQINMVPASSSSRAPERSISKVIDVLRDRILTGYYRPDDWLPTERTLAEDLNVDRRAVRMAVNALVQAGLVHRRPNCRPVVAGNTNESNAAEKQGDAAGTEPAQSSSSRASDFIALIMWPGSGVLEHTAGSQQRIFWGMNQTLAEAGFHAVFLGLPKIASEEENAESEAAHLRYAVERGFGGIVFYPYAYRSNQALVQEISAGMPFVTIDRPIAPLETDFVGLDNRRAMFDMTMHMAAQGHRRIAYVTKCEQILPVQVRIQGYVDAVREAGIPEIVLTIPSRDREEPWLVTDTIFRLPKGERPTAAIGFNDYATVDLMYRLQNLGLAVAGDVALGGFDNVVQILPNGVGLTTMAQPYEEIGKTAVELLLRRMKDPSAPLVSVDLPASLVVRDSSAPPNE